MRRSLQSQLLVPLLSALLAAVALIAIAAAWLAVRRAEEQTIAQIRGVAETLSATSLTFTEPILKRMHALSGAEFIALDQGGLILAATIPVPDDIATATATAPLISRGQVPSLSDMPLIELRDQRSFFAARLRADGAADVSTLLVLYPEASWRDARQAALLPPLVIGAITVALMTMLVSLISTSIARRVQSVQRLLAAIADGRQPEVPTSSDLPRDELDDLVLSASKLSQQLDELHRRERETERLRLLAQLAGGLAHQLRNAITGARMAVQLHQRRCPLSRSDNDRSAGSGESNANDSLSVALRQLSLTEQQIRGLLALSHKEVQRPEPGAFLPLLKEVEQLVRPQFEHAGTRLEMRFSVSEADNNTRVSDIDALRSAALNLLLNALEAAGPTGDVTLTAAVASDWVRIEVSDSGSGPSDDIRDSLFEPFVTTRAEGIGLGLALTHQAARSLGGALNWERRDSRTVFRIEIPLLKD